MGLVIVSCGVLTGLAMTPLGDDVVGACRTAICRITGGKCATATPAAAPTVDAQNKVAVDPGGGGGAAPPPHRNRPAGSRHCDSPTLKGGQPRIHSHNDYQNDDPLDTALESGASSVEADIYYDDGELNARHCSGICRAVPGQGNQGTMDDLYFDKLKKRLRTHGGRIQPGQDDPFVLNVELKDDDQGEKKRAFRKVVSRVRELQAEARKYGGDPDDIQVVFSGMPPNRVEEFAGKAGTPGDTVHSDQQYAGDGCAKALNGTPAHDSAWVSLSWRDCVSGDDLITPKEQAYLNQVVKNAHRHGREVRFWGAPATTGQARDGRPIEPSESTRAAWDAQAKAGVDHINTDNPDVLRKYLGTCA